MTTIIILFLIAFILAVLLTPLVRKIALNFNLLDQPSERKAHTTATPRIGGVAIYFSFFLAFFPCLFFRTNIMNPLFTDPRLIYLFGGSIIVFILGLWDDIKHLGPKVKFGVQIIAAIFTYFGGIQITLIGIPGLPVLNFGWLSLPVTVFWILFVTNAINIVDGLDGLAAGITFFVCIILLILSLMSDNYFSALILAVLSGSVLGFLVFNFNPASIFMGDSGSYFLGYMLAVLSIIGSIKTQTAVTILIPFIALGVPLMDTVWATIRRFIVGKKVFYPDKEHFHHKLILMGFSQRTAVLVLYFFTILMGFVAIIIVNLHDGKSAFLLVIIGIMSIAGIIKLGYFDRMDRVNIRDWLGDIFDHLGFTRKRRLFFGRQIAIHKAENIEELWLQVVFAVELLDIEFIELALHGESMKSENLGFCYYYGKDSSENIDIESPERLYIRFPLDSVGINLGSLVITKNVFTSTEKAAQTFRRISQLRETVSLALYRLMVDEKKGSK